MRLWSWISHEPPARALFICVTIRPPSTPHCLGVFVRAPSIARVCVIRQKCDDGPSRVHMATWGPPLRVYLFSKSLVGEICEGHNGVRVSKRWVK